MHHRRESPKLLFTTLLVLGLLPLSTAEAQTRFSGTTMGPIQYRVVIHDPIPDAAAVEQGIADRLEQVNALMSTYIASSDVSRINQAAANQWVDVHELTLHVIERALGFREATDGAFDITVGPAVNLWSFGPQNPESPHALPSAKEIESVCQYVGYQHIQIRRQPPAVSKRHGQTEIDLSAIAKGFAVDRVASFLVDENIGDFLVEVGGEVIVRGRKPDGPWKIGVEKPEDTRRTVSAVIELHNQALATSGDYRNFRIIDGQRYSHTIDPATCRPVKNRIASSSVLASDCLTADAMATALMVMGVDKGLSYCRDHQLAASIITRSEDGDQLVTAATSDFPERMEPKPAIVGNDSASIWPAFIGALVIFSLAVIGMAIGAILNNRPITGSCGGIAARQNLDGSSSCSLCQKPVSDCPRRSEVAQEAASD